MKKIINKIRNILVISIGTLFVKISNVLAIDVEKFEENLKMKEDVDIPKSPIDITGILAIIFIIIITLIFAVDLVIYLKRSKSSKKKKTTMTIITITIWILVWIWFYFLMNRNV